MARANARLRIVRLEAVGWRGTRAAAYADHDVLAAGALADYDIDADVGGGYGPGFA